MDSFLNGLREREEKEPENFWFGHSRFQIPVRILSYRGRAESRVLAYLYERAGQVSFYSETTVMIEVKVKEEKIAELTGLSPWTVSAAINGLEVDGAIRVSRHRDSVTGQVKTSVYIPLHSQTQQPLLSTPRIYGLCHENRDLPYITCTREARREFAFMSSVGVQIYLAALALASKRVLMSFAVDRDEWRAESALGRKAFTAGVKECAKRKLLSYSRNTLTLHDPRTGKPSVRGKASRIDHDNPTWEFDFNSVQPDEWRLVLKKLLPRFEAAEGSDGWTHTDLSTLCPFCHKERGFRVNFKDAKFQCFKCQNFGRLGQLTQRLLRVTQMVRVKAFIKEVIAEYRQRKGNAELFGEDEAA